MPPPRAPMRFTDQVLGLVGLAVPYASVLVFWCWLENAWASLIAYHALAFVLSRRRLARLGVGWDRRRLLLATLPCVALGPVVVLLLPMMARVPLDSWLTEHGLAGWSRLLLVPYFGCVHPVLEQAHWSWLRSGSWGGAVEREGARRSGDAAHAALAHLAFAGYHLLVLQSLLHPPWLGLCFGVLVLASIGWRRLENATGGGLAVPVLAHVLADSSLVLAAVLQAG